MKRIAVWLLVLVMLCGLCCTGCQPSRNDSADGLRIVTTMFPINDWVTTLVEGASEQPTQVYTMMHNGTDLHNYQPTASDIIELAGCDLFIYVGGESDSWVKDVLVSANNPNMITLNLMEALGSRAKVEETVEGMQGHEHIHEEGEHEEDHDHDHDHEAGSYDEHIWLSLQNAEVLCQAITDKLCEIDPDRADTYRSNMEAYKIELTVLNGEYEAAVNQATTKTLLFADRFPFRYLMDDYGLSYYAAFSGCSTETEAGFDTIRFLAGKVDALDLPCVMALEGNRHDVANAVIAATQSKDQKVLSMNSMQAMSVDEINRTGATYLSIMRQNLDVLKQALGVEIRSEISEADTVL